ncbi:MAG: protein-glutamate O-methyltransferase CheR [Myxococcaceae bacterium]|nr:protein-glutamate O-methyltransferase CheR [Myxococcaceae bacterium]
MTLDPAAFERIRRLVYERAAIVIEPGKEYLVESRLSGMARAHGFEDVNALCNSLGPRHPALLAEVVEAMTTNETSFYRDHHPFEALRQQVLPELIKRRATTHTLRIWCAACSTGQEPYSLAMMLDEFFPRLASWNVSIYATDISKAVIARATAGRYRQVEVDRGLRDGALQRYFHREGLEWEIRAEIRKRVRFEVLNLVGSWPKMPRFDLIFLRNVLIYFDKDTKQSILLKVREQLNDDGYLVLGGSETTPAGVTQFERVDVPRSGLYRAT